MTELTVEELERVFITRREYDEKQLSQAGQFSELLGLMKANQVAVAALASALGKVQEALASGLVDLQKQTTENARQLGILSVYAKLFGPMITAAVGVIGFLIGKL